MSPSPTATPPRCPGGGGNDRRGTSLRGGGAGAPTGGGRPVTAKGHATARGPHEGLGAVLLRVGFTPRLSLQSAGRVLKMRKSLQLGEFLPIDRPAPVPLLTPVARQGTAAPLEPNRRAMQ